MEYIEIKAYKCPFCEYFHTNKEKVIQHSNQCRNNPNYTQECLYCHNLERDFKQRIIFPDSKRPYCCYFYNGGKCPYKNHTNKKLMEVVKKEKEILDHVYNHILEFEYKEGNDKE